MGEQSGDREDKGFVVIDRRGREEPEETSRPTGSEGRDAGKPDPGRESLPRIDFSTFVLSLSTSALYHLGLVPDPETRQRGPVNRDLARQTIDTLELLAEKTRGNLEPDEKQLLESLLYELRMRYVEAG